MKIEFVNGWKQTDRLDDRTIICIKFYHFVLFCIEYVPEDYIAVGIFNFGIFINL